jgi:hypothetical protein
MYKKERFVVGIILAIAGGTIMITSAVFGIRQIAQDRYEDLYSFSVKLTGQKKESVCGGFTAKKNEDLSFWLKVPDRRIENSDLQLEINLSDANKVTDVSWKNDFSFGFWRNSSEKGQYYHLGTQHYKSDFTGTVCYMTKGTWKAPYNGALVIRSLKPFNIPFRDLGFFCVGLLLLSVGIKGILKNKNYME